MKIAGFARVAVGVAFALGAGCDPAKVRHPGTAPERGDGGANTPAPPKVDGGADTSGAVPIGDAGGGAGPGAAAAFTERPCNFRMMPARPVRCGVVVVPEARGGTSTRTVELAVVIIKSASATPAPDPLVFLQGGPGGGGVDFIVALAGGMGGPMDAVLAKRDVISIDQRGTGRSRAAAGLSRGQPGGDGHGAAGHDDDERRGRGAGPLPRPPGRHGHRPEPVPDQRRRRRRRGRAPRPGHTPSGTCWADRTAPGWRWRWRAGIPAASAPCCWIRSARPTST